MGTISKMRFREWLQEMWFQHKEELDGLGHAVDYNLKDYFHKYKYWLKREYKHQMGVQ